jgi:hypothetical protein
MAFKLNEKCKGEFKKFKKLLTIAPIIQQLIEVFHLT